MFTRYLYTILLSILLVKFTHSLGYNVQRLSGPTLIERDTLSTPKDKVDIYCYVGTPKSIFALWQTVKFNIKIKDDEFRQYIGNTPDEVYKQYTEDSYGWSVINPFNNKVPKSVSIQLFNTTCMAINTKQRHTIELQVIRVELWRILLMCFGIVLVLLSRSLSNNPFFFYLCGVFIGISASFMVLIYYVSKLLPKKTLTYGVLIGGWTVGVYVFQQLWDNIRSIITTHQTYTLWYALVMGMISFGVCYQIGPPRNTRSKNLVMWTLQGVGLLNIYLSSQYQEAAAAVIVLTLSVKYFPRSILQAIVAYWRRRFPPKRKLLTDEEYYEEGARETYRALEKLRKHCASPDCAQWRIMLKLNDSKRFASFVEGDSHLRDDEVLDYETYAFSLNKPPNDSSLRASSPRDSSPRESSPRDSSPRASSTGLHEISDDDSSSDTDD